MRNEIPLLVSGNKYSDERGILEYINEFTFQNIKRFYRITHTSTDVIRAWQGHKKEIKYFFCITGSFLINAVKIDDWENPSKNLQVTSFTLTESSPQILMIPAGYGNGLKACAENSSVLVFSSLSREESLLDDYRFDPDLWYDWNG